MVIEALSNSYCIYKCYTNKLIYLPVAVVVAVAIAMVMNW